MTAFAGNFRLAHARRRTSATGSAMLYDENYKKRARAEDAVERLEAIRDRIADEQLRRQRQREVLGKALMTAGVIAVIAIAGWML